MMARLPADPPLFEIIATTGLMIVTAGLVIWGAGAVFRMGAMGRANADSVKRWMRFQKQEAPAD